MTHMTVIVDNQAMTGLRAAWGLSIMVHEPGILFDTGPHPDVLRHNMSKLNITGQINTVVISHLHWDHIGGMSAVAAPACLPEHGKLPGKVCDKPTKLNAICQSTGVLGSTIKEQALICKGSKKTALLVGCSHPGVDILAERAVELAGRVDMIIGGFHLLNASELRIKSVAKKLEALGIREIYPIHCTGANAVKILKSELPDRIHPGYAGLTIEF